MKTINAPNERIKRVYFTYMQEARRYGEQSVDAVAKALHRFEGYMRFKDFKSFHHQQAVGFKAHLSAQVNGRTKEALSKATLRSTLAALKGFFHWLAGQPGYKSKFTYSDAEYFNLGRGDTAIAKAHREQSVPTLGDGAYLAPRGRLRQEDPGPRFCRHARRTADRLYPRPILDYWAQHESTLGEIVTHVLVHEIGHHFGLSDDDMQRIEETAE